MAIARKLMSALAVLACSMTALSQAQTLRWASQGDPQTMDPHSQNESMTNMMNGQVYEKLTTRDRSLVIKPSLATEWQQVNPLLWRFKLRPNVKFHDGAPFSADDVVFSVNRAKEPSSGIAAYASMLGEPKKIDNLTVEFNLQAVQATTNPVAVWIIINGPIARELGVNHHMNCLGEGNWAPVESATTYITVYCTVPAVTAATVPCMPGIPRWR